MFAWAGRALSAVKAGVSASHQVWRSNIELPHKKEQIALTDQIRQLQGTIDALQEQVRELRQLVILRDQRIAELEEQATVRATIVRERNAVWTVEGDKRDGPFCQTCHALDGKLIPLQVTQGESPVGTCGVSKDHRVWLLDPNAPPKPPAPHIESNYARRTREILEQDRW